ncbi:MAG: indole-3-glycerol phosphate synthase TrpC [Alphaproteobacteria bacterium]|nr:indole-3-glycerol phosphate synthase TrpC [Alphaproteobacteria bacterium]
MSDILARICADKRAHIAVARTRRPLAALTAAARAAPPPRGFERALRACRNRNRYGLIAEIKRASPSHGLIRRDFDAAELACAYEKADAACLSVLTDQTHFQGADEHLCQARAATGLPVLRKDFMLDPYQVVEARALGADCVLLIMAALADSAAAELEVAALELGMDVLIEVHDEAELARAACLKSRLVGINNRNLKTLAVDLATSERLAPLLPGAHLVVGESGIRSPADLARLKRVGITTFLVGDALMREADVAAATRALLAEPEAVAAG